MPPASRWAWPDRSTADDDAPTGSMVSPHSPRERIGGIYGRWPRPLGMSTATKITLGTIGVAATLAIALVVVYLA